MPEPRGRRPGPRFIPPSEHFKKGPKQEEKPQEAPQEASTPIEELPTDEMPTDEMAPQIPQEITTQEDFAEQVRPDLAGRILEARQNGKRHIAVYQDVENPTAMYVRFEDETDAAIIDPRRFQQLATAFLKDTAKAAALLDGKTAMQEDIVRLRPGDENPYAETPQYAEAGMGDARIMQPGEMRQAMYEARLAQQLKALEQQTFTSRAEALAAAQRVVNDMFTANPHLVGTGGGEPYPIDSLQLKVEQKRFLRSAKRETVNVSILANENLSKVYVIETQ